MNKGSIVERLCGDLDRKEPRYKSPTLLYFTLLQIIMTVDGEEGSGVKPLLLCHAT